MSTLTHTPVHALARYSYVPFMLLGLNGAGVALIVAGAPKYWLQAVLAVAIAMSFGVERTLPYERSWNHEQGDSARDRIHVAVRNPRPGQRGRHPAVRGDRACPRDLAQQLAIRATGPGGDPDR
jgi:hypothetical protein